MDKTGPVAPSADAVPPALAPPLAASAAAALPASPPSAPLPAPAAGAAFRSHEAREQTVSRLRQAEQRRTDEARARAAREHWPAEGETDGQPWELVAIKGGRVYVRTTFNQDAAISTAADAVRQTHPYDLTGKGVGVGVWDAGVVRATHQEFDTRVLLQDSAPVNHHATHVAGTLGAAGIVPAAQGMAPAAAIESFDWDYDNSEVAQRAMASAEETNKLQITNHSYGFQVGWSSTTWYGTWGNWESEGFGLYDDYAATWDAIAYAAPYVLVFKATGNDRNDSAPPAGQEFDYYDNGWKTKPYDPLTDPPADGWDNGGYDTIPYEGNAKNVMTVGALNDAVAGNARSLEPATMTVFSGWGPCDDGRVKPDIMGNGTSLYSTYSGSDREYRTSSGTSMSTPNVAGSAALLVEYYGRLAAGGRLRASTLKGLILHTADDLGRPGPDYQFGWGLMNTLAAAEQIRRHHVRPNALRLVEDRLTAASLTNAYSFLWDRTRPIRVTLCWTDPPGEVQNELDGGATSLVHDLDLRLCDPAGAVHFPYCLVATNPTAPAAPGDNDVDNVEQIFLPAPSPGRYRVVVELEGVLTDPEQPYALFVTGSGVPPEIALTPYENTTNEAAPYLLDAHLTCETDLNTNRLSVLWNTTGNPRGFAESRLSAVTGSLYRAVLPPQARGARIYYFIRAEAANGLVSAEPPDAPATLHSFAVTPAVSLTVTGTPVEVGTVAPPYGAAPYASGVVVHAAAELLSMHPDGARYTCTGWRGSGSVPPAGSTQALSFVLAEDSVLDWQWDLAYQLVQTSSVAGVIDTTRWWRVGSTAETVAAPSAVSDRQFCGWYVDGQRWPDDTSRAMNPAMGIVVHTQRLAVAQYLPRSLDADGNAVPDWWELYYFGPGGMLPDWDSDGDGYSNLKEYQDGTDPREAGSTPQPPAIAHRPLGLVQPRPGPWFISAEVTDNDAVSRVRLEWNRNASGWLSVPMQATAAGADTYTNCLPDPGTTGDQFVYRIAAWDRSGLRGENGPYAFSIRYPVAVLSPTNFPPFVLPADTGVRSSLLVSNAGHEALAWTLSVTPSALKDDVESGTNAWTHGGDNDVWHVSTQRAYSGTASWFFGSEAAGGYPDRAQAWLLSPVIVPPGGAVLSFRHWLNTEALKDDTHAWDGAFVEISTNDGATFAQIEPEDGYPYVIYGHSASAFPDGTPCFAGTGGWQHVAFDLADYADQAVRLRFMFGSDGYVVNEGWYLDDIEVTPYGGAHTWLNVSPAGETNEPGQARMLTLTVSSAGVAPAETRQAYLRLESTDPLRPQQLVPLTLHNSSRPIEVTWTGAGWVSPSGTVLVTSGSSTTFVMVAEAYHRVQDILTNGVSAGGPFAVTATNFTWPNVTAAGALHVRFAPTRVTNGVPELWLVEHGLTNDDLNAEALNDHDGDGAATWEEYVAGTDPTSPLSVFAFRGIVPWGTQEVSCLATDTLTGEVFPLAWTPADRVLLVWPSASNRFYRLDGRWSPLAGYEALASNLTATPPVNTYTGATGPGGPPFYRLGVRYIEP